MQNNQPLPIVYEGNQYVVINKPAGLIVEENSFESSVEAILQSAWSSPHKKGFVGIVHRLDKVTSGLLIIAKNKQALSQLSQLFQQDKVRKTYAALVEKPPLQKAGYLNHHLEKDQKEKRALASMLPFQGSVPVRIYYRTITNNKPQTLLEIRPYSGKFHQIRAQLALAGSPIVGDIKYGGSPWAHGDQAIALHAYRLQFLDPSTGEKIQLEVPPPFI